MKTIKKSTIRFRRCVSLFYQSASQRRMMKSTIQSYKSRLVYLRLKPLFHVPMSRLTSRTVTQWLNKLKQHQTADRKIRKNFCHELRLLSVILNWYKHFIDERFPMPITKKHRQMCFFKPTQPRRPDYFMKPGSARRWIAWLKKNNRNPVYWQLGFFMLLTGARVGEACGLTWDDIDLKDGRAFVFKRVRWDHSTKRPFLEKVTKTSQSARVLSLPNSLKTMLSEMKKKVVTVIKSTFFSWNQNRKRRA